jgi:uncharacterized SAM-binding protein YcdF (DUF218 family)
MTKLLSREKPRYGRLAYLVIACLILWEIVAWMGARALIVQGDLTRADAMVILSGSSSYRERTNTAAQLFAEGRAAKIILTNDDRKAGWSNSQQRNPLFTDLAFDELVRAGVPKDRINVLQEPVQSTYDEAKLLRRYAEEHSLQSLLIITSPYHSRRALWTFRQEFKTSNIAVGLNVASESQAQQPSALFWWITPRGWRLVAGEYLKFIYYRLR